MARKFLTPIDLNKLELQNAKIQNLNGDPGDKDAGLIYFNTVSGKLKIADGSSWNEVGGSLVADSNSGLSIVAGSIAIDLATTSGLTIDSGDGLRVDASSGLKFKDGSNALQVALKSDGGLEFDLSSSPSGIMIDLATTSGLEVAAGDGLRVQVANDGGLEIAGGFTQTGLKIDLATTSGLEVASGDGLRVDVAPDAGLELLSTGIAVNLATTSGLEFVTASAPFDGLAIKLSKSGLIGDSGLALSTNGIKVNVTNTSGLNITGWNELAIDLAATSGLEVASGDGLRVDVDGNSLNLDSNGLSVKLSSTSGLQVNPDGLGIDVVTDSGLAVDSLGLALDLAATSGLEINSGDGLRIDLATTSGLTLSADGLAVDTSYIATKAYADGLSQGLDVKASVVVATTAAGTLASSFEAGDSVGGRTLVAGDRILIKNQADPIENGIYIVNASGAPTRATDLAAGTNFAGVFVFVESRDNGGKGYVATGNTATDVTVGTHSMNWTQFSEAGSLTAANNGGLSIAGTEISIDLATTSGLEINSGDGLRIDLATSSGLELAAGGLAIDLATTSYLTVDNSGIGVLVDTGYGQSPTGIYAARKYSTTIGNNSSTAYTVTHNFGIRDVSVQVIENTSPYATVEADVERTSTSQVTVKFAVAPATNAYNVIVIG